MPYQSVDELPDQFSQYSEEGKRAALDAYNGCMYNGDGDESRCFAIAHTAAKNVQANSRGGATEGPSAGPAAGGGPRRA